MIEFGYILIILFEVLFALAVVFGLIYLENKVNTVLEEVNIEAKTVLNTIRDVNCKLKSFNTACRKIQKFNFKKAKQGLLLVLDIINFILLIRSMDFKKGQKLSLKNIKKLLPFSLAKKALGVVKNIV